jgi:rRNA maturation RNase YbeY
MKIWIDNRHRGMTLDEEALRRSAQWILEATQRPEAEVSIVLVDDEAMAALNRQYLQREGPTNVIAFSMQEGEGAHVAPQLLGDVVISLDTAMREARTAGIPWEERLLVLLIHGILHLLGHDHMGDAAQTVLMEREEQRLMALIKHKLSERLARRV